ncbi:Ku protein [Cupriavidus oxalaticus]|uniref:Non-homologous end joining protein Ku n=1 Tax=Cupriavidus oxalaticus TaxID=96344 RepID=A0A375FFS5_9BURK|nr:Ku protein [Cupriavidus oxalaticus]QRQ84695.1 Ku protein [Cupriavidus oxalaticus]QRQ91216.1 Ku protein [Cupriavidus oxalaticus]WQD85774.1 Ku protein [Cupriavidus oxalaticus]SPC05017.1 Non-homologous end joining protein Ku [Cupriavidus oxalaticus]SPC20706.1 Non-homologous end joining protein Ku [Cupriavidus oxalaticus]
MSRIIWKGAITFGLVNIPVVLRPASRSQTLDLDLLDVRDMAPVGYQRINKSTGKPIDKEHIVKGYQYAKDEYVLLNDEDFRQANVEATQTVDIVSFVDAESIPPYYFDTPYYLEPDKRGDRGYALLHATMRRTGRAALALVVLRNRQHLAAMLVHGDALVLNTMRFADEVLPISELRVPKASSAKGSGAHAREIEMATRLVEDMTEDWNPEQYRDTYRDDMMARIEAKIESGKTHQLTQPTEDEEAPQRGAKVIDMVALLRKSLGERGKDDEGKGRRRAKPAEEAEAAEETEADDGRASESRGRRKTPARHAAAKKTPPKQPPKRTTAKRTTAAKHAPAKAPAKSPATARKSAGTTRRKAA